MNGTVIGLVLVAAALHATWNALLRTGGDRLWSMTVMSAATAVVALPVAIAAPLPRPASWPFIALSSTLQVGYSLFLTAAYKTGGLAQVYPIARGSAPVLVTVAAFLLAGQRPAPGALAGIATIAAGMATLALGRGRADRRSMLLALGTGCFIAAYTTSDGFGSRAAGNPLIYVAWIYAAYGSLMLAGHLALRGKPTQPIWSAATGRAVIGGVLQLLAYGTVVAALSLGQFGSVAALRETGIIFAAMIGRVFLGETLPPRRLAACGLVALGAVLLAA
ncbi:MAG TPA: EamA family transporter [Acetobacteraceae bacterium]|nr:EamA family transporter [Acetobacteraceae bacterium]